MPRKVDLPETPTPKPKREISEAQREHLTEIRELAMVMKAELKEITLKSKLVKTVPKQELAKQYDEYVATTYNTNANPSLKYIHSHTIGVGVSFTQNWAASHPRNGDSSALTGEKPSKPYGMNWRPNFQQS